MIAVINRKEIQEKLRSILAKHVEMLVETDSKKIKKIIKKASKSIAKAIVKSIEESDGQLSLKKQTNMKKPVQLKLKTSSKKEAKVTPVKRSSSVPSVKGKNLKTNKRTAPKKKHFSKPLLSVKKQKAETAPLVDQTPKTTSQSVDSAAIV